MKREFYTRLGTPRFQIKNRNVDYCDPCKKWVEKPHNEHNKPKSWGYLTEPL